MKKILCILCAIVALFAILALSSCAPDGEVEEVTFIIDRTALNMSVGDVYKMTYTALPKSETDSVTWESSNESVVTCEGGVIIAVGDGRARIKATHSSGNYAVCSVTVGGDGKLLFVIEGQSVSLKERDINAKLNGADCISTDSEVASLVRDSGGVVISANKKGKCDIKLETDSSSMIYYNVVVLSAEDSGVSVTTDELPFVVNYDGGRYRSAIKITDLQITRTATRELLDEYLVQVELVFSYEKIFDSEGNDAENPVCFALEAYSGESEGLIRTIDVETDWISVNETSEKKESFTYIFNAMLDVGEVGRSFTFRIVEVSK